MPFNGIAIITGELVVEIVVSFAESDKSSDDVISRRVAVIKWLVAEPMGQGVHAEGSLLDEEYTEDTSVDKSTDPVTPSETSNKRWEDQPHEDNNPEIMLVLPNNNRILVQVGDVCSTDSFRVLLQNHPSQMRVHKTLADTIRVFIGIGITMVSPVIPRPPTDRSLNGTTSNSGKENLKRNTRGIRRVSPETMVPSGYAETGPIVVGDRPDEGLSGQRRVKRSPDTKYWDEDDECDIEFVQMKPPIAHSNGLSIQ